MTTLVRSRPMAKVWSKKHTYINTLLRTIGQSIFNISRFQISILQNCTLSDTSVLCVNLCTQFIQAYFLRYPKKSLLWIHKRYCWNWHDVCRGLEGENPEIGINLRLDTTVYHNLQHIQVFPSDTPVAEESATVKTEDTSSHFIQHHNAQQTVYLMRIGDN